MFYMCGSFATSCLRQHILVDSFDLESALENRSKYEKHYVLQHCLKINNDIYKVVVTGTSVNEKDVFKYLVYF